MPRRSRWTFGTLSETTSHGQTAGLLVPQASQTGNLGDVLTNPGSYGRGPYGAGLYGNQRGRMDADPADRPLG